MARRLIIEVSGMACEGCERSVENALRTLGGIHRVDADHEGDAVEVVVEDTVNENDLETAIRDAGYEVAT